MVETCELKTIEKTNIYPSIQQLSSPIEIRELKTIQEVSTIYPLIKQHHKINNESFKVFLKEMMTTGYHCFGLFKDNVILATAGFWIGVRFYCGKYMYINNFVVDENTRSQGIGKNLLDFLEGEAKKYKCKALVLDSYVHNSRAHRFYFREGYIISNFHFKKDLTYP
jgi:GNAT superfamily N-acetyltransferase